MHSRRAPDACRNIGLLRLNPEEAAKEMIKEPSAVKHFQHAIKQKAVYDGRIFTCHKGKWRPSVDAYGQLQICLMLRHPKTKYDLLSGNLVDAIKRYLPVVRNATTENMEYLSRCGVCILRPACSQCPASSWTECGALDKPTDYYCEVTHVVARLLGLLNDGEKGWEIQP